MFFSNKQQWSILVLLSLQKANPLQVNAEDASSLSSLSRIIDEHLAQNPDPIEDRISASLESVTDSVDGSVSALPNHIWTQQTDFTPDEQLALDSAYNMGVRGALEIKAQLITNQLASHLGINQQLILDGGFGENSEALLEAVLTTSGLEFTGNQQTDFMALRGLYEQKFGEPPTLFLTADEINHPDIQFENKGVFRGTQAARISAVFAEHGLNQATLEIIQEELDIDLTRKFERNFEMAQGTLNDLNIPEGIQGRILATMILETGLSQPDLLGVDIAGRGDRKAALQWASYLAPQATALTTGRLSITSAGITQVNFRTAQTLIAEHTGTVLPRREILNMLQNNDQAAILMAVLVYYDNQNQITRLRDTYQSTPNQSGSEPMVMAQL